MQTQTKKNKYELIFLMAPEIQENDAENQNKKLEEIVTGLNGEITKTKTAEKKRLAYPVKRNRNAYCGFIHFDINPENLPELRKKIDFENNIIRYLITKFEKFPEPKIFVQQKPKFKSETVQIAKEEDIKNQTPKTEIEQIKKAEELAEIDKKLEEILNE